MKVIGIRCSKDQVHWVVLEGTTRGDAQVVAYEEPQAPADDRSEQLAWMRLELLEVLKAHQPDRASLRVAEAGPNPAGSLLRAEADGVVQATLSERGVPVSKYYAATVRGALSAKNKVATEAASAAIPCVAAVTKSRRDQVVVAAVAFPA